MATAAHPWTPITIMSDLIHVISAPDDSGKRQVIAIVDGTDTAANAALICAAPEMADAIRAGHFATARTIVARLDGAAS